MLPDLDIRRSLRKLSRADLAGCPVWEWALDGEDGAGQSESLLRPSDLAAIPAQPGRQYVVGATVTLSDGSVLPACVELSVQAGRVRALPMFILLQERQLDFGGPETLATLALYTKAAGVHPRRWQLLVPLEGRPALLEGAVRRSLSARIMGLFRRRVPAPIWRQA